MTITRRCAIKECQRYPMQGWSVCQSCAQRWFDRLLRVPENPNLVGIQRYAEVPFQFGDERDEPAGDNPWAGVTP